MHQTTPDRRRPSLWWLLLVPVLALTGIGVATALATATFVGVVDEALTFGQQADLAAGTLTIWVDDDERPERVRLLGPSDVEVPLAPAAGERTVQADGATWTAGCTATITEPGRYRVEATGGRAALRAPNQLDTGTVRRNGVLLPVLVFTVGVTASVLVAVIVLTLRLSNPAGAAPGRTAAGPSPPGAGSSCPARGP